MEYTTFIRLSEELYSRPCVYCFFPMRRWRNHDFEPSLLKENGYFVDCNRVGDAQCACEEKKRNSKKLKLFPEYVFRIHVNEKKTVPNSSKTP